MCWKDIPTWGIDEAVKVVKAELIEGTEKKTFAPNKETTRAEAATAIYRFYVK